MNQNNQNTSDFGFRSVPRTGVIYVMAEAEKSGYSATDPEWVNLGQGQPEAGVLEGAPERLSQIKFGNDSLEYAPVNGIKDLRKAVADFYNRNYRDGQSSQYTWENVCIAPGGRAALTRIAAGLSSINLGHFLPDYTAYEELLEVFKSFNPIPILLEPEKGYEFSTEELKREILGRGLGVILMSNPCNPTGKLVGPEKLNEWVEVCRDLECTLILDEFYSHYIWDKKDASSSESTRFSSAKYIEDVNHDPVVILDGLTKNWRYPGFRIAWIVGPKSVIEAVSSAGSFLDGGASHPLQTAAIHQLSPEVTNAETAALQKCFSSKRSIIIEKIRSCGIEIDCEPQGTFYLWVNIKNLPQEINDGMSFFRKALEKKVIVVPGEFFDVDPGGRRSGRPSRFRHHLRISFGTNVESLVTGLDRIAEMIEGR